MTDSEFRYMKEGIATDLIQYLVTDYHVSLQEALRILYESDTYSKLSDPSTGIYFQSSRYVFTFLQHELQTGVIG